MCSVAAGTVKMPGYDNSWFPSLMRWICRCVCCPAPALQQLTKDFIPVCCL